MTNEVDRWHHQLDDVSVSQKDFWSVNNIRYVSKVMVSHVVSVHQGLSLVKVSTLFHMWKLWFQGVVYIRPVKNLCTKSLNVKRQKYKTVFEAILMITVIIMKKCLKTWMGIFRVGVFLIPIYLPQAKISL